MGWLKNTQERLQKKVDLKKVASYAAAPFTVGASLAFTGTKAAARIGKAYGRAGVYAPIVGTTLFGPLGGAIGGVFGAGTQFLPGVRSREAGLKRVGLATGGSLLASGGLGLLSGAGIGATPFKSIQSFFSASPTVSMAASTPSIVDPVTGAILSPSSAGVEGYSYQSEMARFVAGGGAASTFPAQGASTGDALLVAAAQAALGAKAQGVPPAGSGGIPGIGENGQPLAGTGGPAPSILPLVLLAGGGVVVLMILMRGKRRAA